MHSRSNWKDNLFILLALCMMGILYFSSSQPYGDQSVTSLLDWILSGEPFGELLSNIQFSYGGNVVSIDTLGYSHFIEFFLRKGAHFGTYFLLGAFWFLGLKNKMDGIGLPAFVSWLLAAGYASFDEFHQGLTPDRTPLLADILLDSFGALTGIVLVFVFFGLFQKRKLKTKYRV